MTIPATIPRNTYTGNNVTTAFPYTFRIFDASEIVVFIDGFLATTGYTVDGVDETLGGNVHITPPPANGVKILIMSSTILSQATDWTANDPDPAEAKERAFDKLTKIDQEQNEILGRIPQYRVTETFTQPRIEAPVTGQFLRHKDNIGNIDSATLTVAGALAVPVNFVDGGTSGSYASREALLLGLHAGQWAAGSPLLAGATVTFPNPLTGNYFSINGSTGIANFSNAGVAIGTILHIIFVGNPLLTHSANLRLIGAVDYQVVAGDKSTFIYAAVGEWHELYRALAPVASQTTKFWRGDGSWQDPMATIVGGIMMYAGAVAPTGWALCNGAAVSRTTFAVLFSVIGTTYGLGDGSTTFNLPNLKGRVPAGLDATDAYFPALGTIGGAKTHTLLEAEMPGHTHFTVMGTLTPGAGFNWAAASGPVENRDVSFTGGGAAHNNMQPYIVVNYIIRMQ